MKCRYEAMVTGVYDGDTITVDIDLGMHIVLRKVKLRLARINTPEVRGEERELGLVSREWLRDAVLNKQVTIDTFKDKTGKYGRYIVEVYRLRVNINDALVERGLAEYREY